MLKDTLHIKAPGNWINDPNGFIYYRGTYHLFYQYFPYAPEWGTMHWGHAISKDLVHWEHVGIALYPSKDYDQNGVFSGTGIEKDGKLYLYYSAVKYLETDPEDIHRSKNEQFETSQAMLISEDGYTFDNYKNKTQIIPVLHKTEVGHPTNTRDPKVWSYKEKYYMLLGSTVENQKGRILFFESIDGKEWKYKTQYCHPNFGVMLECPDLFCVDGQYVFVGSPMHNITDGLEYTNNSICAIVEFTEETCGFHMEENYQYVDYGLDLYAPQTNLDKEGNRVMIAWMRMPEVVMGKEERKNWNGMMGSPRVVRIIGKHIYFQMHPEVDRYLSVPVKEKDNIIWEESFRIKTTLKPGERLDIGGYCIRIEEDCLVADRSKMFTKKKGYRLLGKTPELHGECRLDIIVDQNLIEIFVNEGKYVISHVVYRLGKWIEGPVEAIYTGR